MVYGKKVEEKDEKPIEKEKPNFNLSGKLSESQATFKNVKLKWIEPSEATAPKKNGICFRLKEMKRWRVYRYIVSHAIYLEEID